MTSAERLPTARATLEVGDADVYAFALGLLGHLRAERFAVPPTGAAPSEPLTLALSRALPVAVLRFVANGGGERAGRVLRRGLGGAIVAVDVALSGRDDDGGDGLFDVRLSAFPGVAFLLAKEVMPFVDERAGGDVSLRGLGRAERQRLRASLPPPVTATGDHLAYACAVSCMPRMQLPSPYDALLTRAFAGGSPLAALFALDDPELEPVDVAALLRPPLVRAVELLAPTIGVAVARAATVAAGRSHDLEELRASCAAVARQGDRLLRGLDQAGRLDLVEPLLKLCLAMPTLAPPELRARLVRLPGVQTMADRDRAIAAVDQLFDLTEAVYAALARLADVRFGDDRAIEARVVAGLTGPALAARPAVLAARRALLGAVG